MCEMGGWLTWLCLCVGMGALDGVSVCGGGLQCLFQNSKSSDGSSTTSTTTTTTTTTSTSVDDYYYADVDY